MIARLAEWPGDTMGWRLESVLLQLILALLSKTTTVGHRRKLSNAFVRTDVEPLIQTRTTNFWFQKGFHYSICELALQILGIGGLNKSLDTFLIGVPSAILLFAPTPGPFLLRSVLTRLLCVLANHLIRPTSWWNSCQKTRPHLKVKLPIRCD